MTRKKCEYRMNGVDRDEDGTIIDNCDNTDNETHLCRKVYCPLLEAEKKMVKIKVCIFCHKTEKEIKRLGKLYDIRWSCTDRMTPKGFHKYCYEEKKAKNE